MKDHVVSICLCLRTFLSPKESLETTFLPTLLAAASTRLAINQRVTMINE